MKHLRSRPALAMCGRRSQLGQSMVEFIIIAPLLLFFCLAIVQFALLYQAKSTLDVAVLEAAREGAVTNGSMRDMQAGLARGLMPLYARNTSTDGVETAGKLAELASINASLITIVNPTPEAISAFAVQRRYPESGLTYTEIPNDSLMYRDPHPAAGTVNIQDANLLKIRVHYCYPMYVPLANKVIYYASNLIGRPAQNGIFSDIPSTNGFGNPQHPDRQCNIYLQDGVETGRYPIGLESEVMVRMQSPFRPAAAANGKAPS
ncbi:TadE/TadG family type IV pilus assembly protein [Paraburkholderia bonniea]|uniref:TadE/TadG family type IV pilus assembly protein n=1 Tax=Paraburkholderia bonniea TaxID=2152891 RepID=UPI001FE25256|nr:TadE/TadG family type IV pilus assembly protein [Paraburkholderia bonniea]WJF91768.1 TadE/TadG family type IV pilus assembly protein [Paraburkholderia bonniea]WJF95088.1 TadE/TadG family type IV pilus assembly protein [Paraburkholderia bonniea]